MGESRRSEWTDHLRSSSSYSGTSRHSAFDLTPLFFISKGKIYMGKKTCGVRGLVGLEDLEGFPGGSVVKNLLANAGDTSSIPGPGRSHMKPVRHKY